jgi:hypothetical protein
MRSASLGLVCLVACTKPAPAPQPPATPTPSVAPAPTVTQTTPVATPPKDVVKNQPPHVKLKIGHYTSGRTGIGLVIDQHSARTENIADIDPVKVRFDGDDKIYTLVGTHGPHDRIDYWNGKRVMLHAYDHGRFGVYVPDPETERSSDELRLVRDGDADPL